MGDEEEIAVDCRARGGNGMRGEGGGVTLSKKPQVARKGVFLLAALHLFHGVTEDAGATVVVTEGSAPPDPDEAQTVRSVVERKTETQNKNTRGKKTNHEKKQTPKTQKSNENDIKPYACGKKNVRFAKRSTQNKKNNGRRDQSCEKADIVVVEK